MPFEISPEDVVRAFDEAAAQSNPNAAAKAEGIVGRAAGALSDDDDSFGARVKRGISGRRNN